MNSQTLDQLAEKLERGGIEALSADEHCAHLFRDLQSLIFRAPGPRLANASLERSQGLLTLTGDLERPFPDGDGLASLERARVQLCFFECDSAWQCVLRVTGSGDAELASTYLTHLAAHAGMPTFDGIVAADELLYSSVDAQRVQDAGIPSAVDWWPSSATTAHLPGVIVLMTDLQIRKVLGDEYQSVTGTELPERLGKGWVIVRRSRRPLRRVAEVDRVIDPWGQVAPNEDEDEHEDDDEAPGRDGAHGAEIVAGDSDGEGSDTEAGGVQLPPVEYQFPLREGKSAPKLDLGFFQVAVARIDLRASGGDHLGPGPLEAVLQFDVDLGGSQQPPVRLEAAIDLEDRSATISSVASTSLADFVRVGSMLFAAPGGGLQTDGLAVPPQLLAPLSAARLDDAWIEVQLPRPSGRDLLDEEEEGDVDWPQVRALGFTASVSGIDLIPGFCRFDASVTACVSTPFDPELREFAAMLEGDLVVGDVPMAGSLVLPEGRFQAEARFGVIGNVFKALGVPPPPGNGGKGSWPDLAIKVAVAGDWRQKVFEAAVIFDGQHDPLVVSLAGLSLKLHDLGIAMRRETSSEWALFARLKVGDLDFSAYAQMGEGWLALHGSMVGELDLVQAARDLFGDGAPLQGLPGDVTAVKLSDVTISVTLGGEVAEFALRGRARLAVGGQVGLTIESFFFARTSAGISTRLVATLSLGELELSLSAVKRPGDDSRSGPEDAGGWVFNGGLRLRDKTSLGHLAEEIAKGFSIAVPDTPAALSDLKVAAIHVKYYTAAERCEFDAEVSIEAGGRTLQTRILMVVSGKVLQFKLHVSVGESVFSGSYVKGEACTAAIAKASAPVSLGSVVRAVFSGLPVLPGVDVELSEAFLLHASEQQGSALALGLKLRAEAAVPLANVPVVGALLDQHARIGIEDLHFLVSSGEVSRAAAETLESDFPSWARLSSEVRRETGGAPVEGPAIAAGIVLSGRMALGTPDSQPFAIGAGEFGGPTAGSDNVDKSKADTDKVDKPTAGIDSVEEPQQDSAHWIDVHRKLGPLRFERIGISFESTPSPGVAVLLDTGFEVAGLRVSIDGLAMRSPLDRFSPSISLSGLGIDYRNPAIEIGGGLLLMGDGSGFAGTVIARSADFSLTAMGTFSQVGNQPTLFVYATLDHAFGGPPFFFVTGLAAGLGYNRDILLPEAEGVEDFPLVKWADPGATSSAPKDPLAAVSALGRHMPPAVGSAFVAIGVAFTSFKVMNSFALLVGKLGGKFELDLLGISHLTSPPAGTTPGQPPVAQATLALRARFVPEDGVLGVRAVLGPDCFVLSRDCHLDGGFAFSAWFKKLDKIEAGDFVVTLGGYHPLFVPPPHYPAVPRLGVQWRVSPNLSIKGNAYLALTGGAVMAGGRFEAVWQSGDVRAAFTAAADFLMTWKPYHYDISVRVSISAEVTIHVFGTHHLTFDAGADVHLWGPSFSGLASLHLKVIGFDVDFDVRFGDQPALSMPIDWTDFRDSFLPAQPCTIAARSGLLDKIAPSLDRAETWIVSPDASVLVFETAIPFSAATVSGASVEDWPYVARPPAVSPMALNSPDFVSTVTVRITSEHEPRLRVSPVLKAMPAGLWGDPRTKTEFGKTYLQPAQANDPRLVANMMSGLAIAPSSTLDREGAIACEGLGSTGLPAPHVRLPARPPWQDSDLAGDARARRDEMLRAMGVEAGACAA